MSESRDTSDDVNYSSNNLREFMRTHGKSVSQIATLLGVTNQAVIYWTQGKRTIPEPLGRLFNLFDQNPDLMDKF